MKGRGCALMAFKRSGVRSPSAPPNRIRG